MVLWCQLIHCDVLCRPLVLLLQQMSVGVRMVVLVSCRHDVGGSSRDACVPLDFGDALVKHRVSSIGQHS